MADGVAVGLGDGCCVGSDDGMAEGVLDGLGVGVGVGIEVGRDVGQHDLPHASLISEMSHAVGFRVSALVQSKTAGLASLRQLAGVGAPVGVGVTGLSVGTLVGDRVGLEMVGIEDGCDV